MIKGLIRLVGFLLVAAGFVVIVIDGTASIAANGLRYTALRDLIRQTQPTGLATLEARLRHVDPRLWDPIATATLQAPASITVILLGILLLLLGRKTRNDIGHPARL